MEEKKSTRIRWTDAEKSSIAGDFLEYSSLRNTGATKEAVVQKQKDLEAKYHRPFPSLAAMASYILRKNAKKTGGDSHGMDK